MTKNERKREGERTYQVDKTFELFLYGLSRIMCTSSVAEEDTVRTAGGHNGEHVERACRVYDACSSCRSSGVCTLVMEEDLTMCPGHEKQRGR